MALGKFSFARWNTTYFSRFRFNLLCWSFHFATLYFRSMEWKSDAEVRLGKEQLFGFGTSAARFCGLSASCIVQGRC